MWINSFLPMKSPPRTLPANKHEVKENCNTTLQTELNILKQAFGGDEKSPLNENCKCKNRSGQETKKKAKNQEEMK